MNKLLQTKSFKLAAFIEGNSNANKMAICIPGRLDSKDYAHLRSHVSYLAKHDYLALSFDPPGTWKSPGDIESYTTTNTLKAVDELIDYFGKKPTILIGHSRGGTIAMLAGISNVNVSHIISIMSQAGPSTVGLPSTTSDITISYRDLPPGSTRTKNQKMYALPYSYFNDQSGYDALKGLKTCTKPKLFFYGTDDELVSADDVKRLYTLSAKPKMIKELDCEHDYRLHPDIINEVNQTIGVFLSK